MSAAMKLIPFEALAGKGIHVGRCQIWRLEKAGKFPKRVPISAARHAWVEAKIAARQPAAA